MLFGQSRGGCFVIIRDEVTRKRVLEVVRPEFSINPGRRSFWTTIYWAPCTSVMLTMAALTTTSRRVITIGIGVNGFRGSDTVIRAENSGLYRGWCECKHDTRINLFTDEAERWVWWMRLLVSMKYADVDLWGMRYTVLNDLFAISFGSVRRSVHSWLFFNQLSTL